MNSFFLKLSNKFKILKNDLPLLYILIKDKRTPVSTRVLIGLTVVYFFSPIDLIPDFIPVLGLVDDIFVVPLLASFAIKTVPEQILFDARNKLQASKSRIKVWVLSILILIVLTIAFYYGYQYYINNADY